MSVFKFNLGDQAKIIVSNETGHIVGRAEYATAENTYSLHYKCADGRAVDAWWSESLLEAVNAIPVCGECKGRGITRVPYSSSSEYEPCWECNAASLPSSTVSATTDDSEGSPGLHSGSIK